MKWSDEKAIVLKIGNLVVRALERENYDLGGFPGYEWVKEEVKNTADGDWGNAAVFEENVNDIIQQAKEWIKNQGFKPTSKRKGTKNQGAVSKASLGQTYGVMTALESFVSQIRLRVWGHTESLFKQNEYENALKWIDEVCNREAKEFFKTYPQTFSLRLVFTTKAESKAISQLIPHDDQKRGSAPLDVKSYLKDLSALLNEPNIEVDSLKLKSIWNETETTHHLRIKLQNGKTESRPTFPGTKIRALQKGIRDLLFLTTWWSEDEALKYLMLGEVPKSGISVKASSQFDETPKPSGLARLLNQVAHPTDDAYWNAYREAWETLFEQSNKKVNNLHEIVRRWLPLPLLWQPRAEFSQGRYKFQPVRY